MNNLTSLTLAAGEARHFNTTAKFLTIKTTTLPIFLAFNNGPEVSVQAGSGLALPNNGGTSQISMRNVNTTAVTINFWLADELVPFSAQDSSQSLAATVIEGNLGIPVSAAAGSEFAGSPACDANGLLSITNGMNLLVSGRNSEGHRRQYITLTMAAQSVSAFSLNILDVNGAVAMTLLPGALIAMPVDSDLYLSGAGGTAKVSIGQHFLAQN